MSICSYKWATSHSIYTPSYWFTNHVLYVWLTAENMCLYSQSSSLSCLLVFPVLPSANKTTDVLSKWISRCSLHFTHSTFLFSCACLHNTIILNSIILLLFLSFFLFSQGLMSQCADVTMCWWKPDVTMCWFHYNVLVKLIYIFVYPIIDCSRHQILSNK